jgi:hypothetical protein
MNKRMYLQQNLGSKYFCALVVRPSGILAFKPSSFPAFPHSAYTKNTIVTKMNSGINTAPDQAM